jgi:hypothetical protein
MAAGEGEQRVFEPVDGRLFRPDTIDAIQSVLHTGIDHQTARGYHMYKLYGQNNLFRLFLVHRLNTQLNRDDLTLFRDRDHGAIILPRISKVYLFTYDVGFAEEQPNAKLLYISSGGNYTLTPDEEVYRLHL